MTKELVRLLTWLSPAFPVGAFSYSSGLEGAVHDRLVEDGENLQAWIDALLHQGAMWNDAVLLAESWRCAAAGGNLSEVSALACALAGSRQRHRETVLQGAAFLKAARPWCDPLPEGLHDDETAYPVAVGAVAGRCGIPPRETLAAYLHAAVSNMVQAAIRLSVLGQVQATAVMAGLEKTVLETAMRAAGSTLDDLGSAALAAEAAAMRHETQHSRLFRS